MPVDAKPLFRPEVLRPHLAGFQLPQGGEALRAPLRKWADMLASAKADTLNEKELLPDFLTDIFCGVLGYKRVVDSQERHTFSREKFVQVDGKYADAALGEFTPKGERFVVAVEGKGPKDPLDRAYAGRKMSAVDQGYRYAINLPCDWIIVTSMRQTRLYHKNSDQHTFERFDTTELAGNEAAFKRFVFLLGAERVVPVSGRCHFYDLLAETERVGRELTKEFYLRYADMRERAFEHLRKANPQAQPAALLRTTQKLLDRVLFCCFAEDRGLLPDETVQKAYTHADPYNPKPVWENFRGLFRAINGGNPALKIPAYNGGLFADDNFLDGLQIPDEVCGYFQELAGYNFQSAFALPEEGGDEASGPLVDVDILGHIFEQSITDLERLHGELEGKLEATTREERVSRRKKEGAFYTPPFITRYIVGQALGGVLRDRFEQVRQRHAAQAEGTARHVLQDPTRYDTATINKPQRGALTLFWEDWQEELGRIRVLDPACGSGAFLIEAFDQLQKVYSEVNDRLEFLRGHRSLFDLDRHILQHNLFGVDLNDEAIEICRLSLWIKTAERGKALTSLDESIRPGNSIVADPALDARAFDWQTAFKHVLDEGGFDVVVGNPPYVRQEWLAPIKPYLKEHYRTFNSVADLYVYFYELGLRLLLPGGRLSFIVTNKWLKAEYGEPLRTFLSMKSWVESIVDFGHAKQIFVDADVFPCILLARKPDAGNPPATSRACTIPREQLQIEDLSRQIDEKGVEIPRTRLAESPWSLEPPAVEELLQKIRANGVALKEYVGAKPIVGIKTGLNEAFLLDTATKERLTKEDPKSSELLRPFIRGQDVDRWGVNWSGLWMLSLKSSGDYPWPWADAGEKAEEVFGETFPAIYRHLLQFRDALQQRQDKGKYWWELRSCAYWDIFDQQRIVYQEIQYHPCYALAEAGLLGNNKTFFLTTADLYLLAILNSPLMWWYNWRYLPHMKDEALSPVAFKVEELPIAQPSAQVKEAVESQVARILTLSDTLQRGQKNVVDWLRVEYEISKPSQRLLRLTDLDEEQFLTEVRKLRGKKKVLSPSALRALRDGFSQSVVPLQKANVEIIGLEREVADLVNQAFALSDSEVALLWKTAPPRMPHVIKEVRVKET